MCYRQLLGAVFIIGWNIVWTSLILLFIKHALRVPLRMSEKDLLIGDDAIHGEAAYSLLEDIDHEKDSQGSGDLQKESLNEIQVSPV